MKTKILKQKGSTYQLMQLPAHNVNRLMRKACSLGSYTYTPEGPKGICKLGFMDSSFTYTVQRI